MALKSKNRITGTSYGSGAVRFGGWDGYRAGMPKKGALQTAATEQLVEEDVPYAVHQYGGEDEVPHVPTVAGSRRRAIEMGIDPARVLHTELAITDGQPVITAVPASAVLDTASLAAAVKLSSSISQTT